MPSVLIYPDANDGSWEAEADSFSGVIGSHVMYQDQGYDVFHTWYYMAKIPLTAIPAGQNISDAYFSVYRYNVGGGVGTVGVGRLSTAFTDNSNGGPDGGEAAIVKGDYASNKPAANGSTGRVQFNDLEALVQDWYSGAVANHGIVLYIREPKPTSSSVTDIEFHLDSTAASGTTDDPYLYVTYAAAPTAPVVTAPNGGETYDQSMTVTWTAATDADTSQASLRYQVQLSGNSGGSWSTVVSLTAAGATSATIDVSSQPEGSTYRVRVRAYDGVGYGPWDSSNADFNIYHVLPVPTALVPVHGATVNTDTPTLQATITPSGSQQQRIEWQIASDSGFTTNLKTIIEDVADYTTSGVHSEVVSVANQLFQGTWYIRARALRVTGTPSAWTATNSFTVSHPPVMTPVSPVGTLGIGVPTGDPTKDVLLDWNFTDTSPVDAQTAYEVDVENNADGVIIYNGAKVASTDTQLLVTIAAADFGKTFRWRGRVWDSDDVTGGFSGYNTFRVAYVPVVAIQEPAHLGILSETSPEIAWTYTVANGRVQQQYRVRFIRVSDSVVVHDSGFVTSTDLFYNPNQSILTLGTQYDIEVTVVDNWGISGVDTNRATAQWTAPQPPAFTVDVTPFDEDGYVRITWDDSTKDAEFYSYRIYRRVPGADSGVLVGEVRDDIASYEYRDFMAPSSRTMEWAVVQVANRFGSLIESEGGSPGYIWHAATPIGTHYWLIFDNDSWADNFALRHVMGDSFTEEYEEADHLLVGRGKKKEYGTRYGYVGTLDCQLRDYADEGAREKRLQLESFKAQRRAAYLKNPFGDVFLVALGNIQITRIPGVGTQEFSDVTIPYSEVSE